MLIRAEVGDMLAEIGVPGIGARVAESGRCVCRVSEVILSPHPFGGLENQFMNMLVSAPVHDVLAQIHVPGIGSRVAESGRCARRVSEVIREPYSFGGLIS